MRGLPEWRVVAFVILHRAHSPGGGVFSKALLFLIFTSVVCFVLSTEASYYAACPWFFDGVESATVLIFTAEFFVRLATVGIGKRLRPAAAVVASSLERSPSRSLSFGEEVCGALAFCVSFEGLVDLASIVPWWVERTQVFGPMPTTTPVRVLRVLRILNHAEFLGAVKVLARDL